MSDLISRQDAIDAITKAFGMEDHNAVAIIKAIPSADRPQKVVAQVTFDEEKLREIVKGAVERFKEEYEITDRQTGMWENVYSGLSDDTLRFRCNICGKLSDGRHNFCPNCGAEMTGNEI